MTVAQRILVDESGQALTEYAIFVGTLALGAIVILLAVGSRLREIFLDNQTPLIDVPRS
jgi:Flp pilus assembly pilin Flp